MLPFGCFEPGGNLFTFISSGTGSSEVNHGSSSWTYVPNTGVEDPLGVEFPVAFDSEIGGRVELEEGAMGPDWDSTPIIGD